MVPDTWCNSRGTCCHVWGGRYSWTALDSFVYSSPHLLIGASGCPLCDIHFQNLNLSLSMPTVLMMPPSTDASKWPPGTSLSTVLMQRATTRSSSRRCVSEGAGSNGIVLNDFLSSGGVWGGSTVAVEGAAVAPEVASVEASGRAVLASLSSAALTIKEMKTKQMGEAIAVSLMLRVMDGRFEPKSIQIFHEPSYTVANLSLCPPSLTAFSTAPNNRS